MIPPDLLLCIAGLSGWPVSFLIGYRFGFLAGHVAAPRRIIQWGADVVLRDVRQAEPVLIERAEGDYARLSWDLLTARQWRALLETTATNALCGAGKPFDRSEFERARDVLIARRMAYWRDPADRQKGWELTKATWRAIVVHTGGALPRSVRPIR